MYQDGSPVCCCCCLYDEGGEDGCLPSQHRPKVTAGDKGEVRNGSATNQEVPRHQVDVGWRGGDVVEELREGGGEEMESWKFEFGAKQVGDSPRK